MRKYHSKIIIIVIALVFACVSFARAEDLAERLSGRILLQVEDVGQAWYIDPSLNQRAFLGRPDDAFRIMRELGLGISENDYNSFNSIAPSRLSGKILLRVEANGEAYYVYPIDLRLYYLGRPADAFRIMREKGLGVTNNNLNTIPINEKYKEVVEVVEPEPEVIPESEQDTTPEPEPEIELIPTIEFKVNNSDNSEVSLLIGEEFRLTWSSEDADSCEFINENGDEDVLFTEDDKLSGSKSIISDSFEDKNYNYICENNIGSSTKTLIVKTEPYITIKDNDFITHNFKVNKIYDNIGEFSLINNTQNKAIINKVKIKFENFHNLNNSTEFRIFLRDKQTSIEYDRTCSVSQKACEREIDISSENFEILEKDSADGNNKRDFILKIKISEFIWYNPYNPIKFYLTNAEFSDSENWPENAIVSEDNIALDNDNPIYFGSLNKN